MGLATLLDDLQRLGLLDETLVVAMGEFGRTPKINPNAGRDHHGRANCALLAGAGIPKGAVIGKTDAIGDSPIDRPVTPSRPGRHGLHRARDRPQLPVRDPRRPADPPRGWRQGPARTASRLRDCWPSAGRLRLRTRRFPGLVGGCGSWFPARGKPTDRDHFMASSPVGDRSSFTSLVDSGDASIFAVETSAEGPVGSLPLTDVMLRDWPSGDLFGLTQNAGMGWKPAEVDRDPYLILSTQGGLRGADGSPVALGYHTGHWEVGLLVQEAAEELKALGMAPFAGMVSDPCDGRTQGTPGMMDSLPYRNDAAIVFRRLIRSLPRRKGVLGVATCDKGLPAMLLALAGSRNLPGVLVPGGVTLPPRHGEDAGKIQSIGARYAHGELALKEAAELGCRACATAGGGCQFLGTAATAQVVAEALGLSVPHAALAPSGQAIWRDVARRSARALVNLADRGLTSGQILSQASIRNAMTVHAAFGGSTNLLLHIPAIAFAAGLPRPTVDDWTEINRKTPRLVDVLPNGPSYHPTIRAYLAGGVPEVMLHLRSLGLLDLGALTVTGETLGRTLDWWAASDRRVQVRDRLLSADGVDPDDVIMDPARARARGLTSTVTFPRGNLAPEGSVIKSTAIDPSVVGS